MSITYENTRIHFDTIARQYKEYVVLYKFCNNGSIEGLTPFQDFYWRMTYFSRYDEATQVATQGY